MRRISNFKQCGPTLNAFPALILLDDTVCTYSRTFCFSYSPLLMFRDTTRSSSLEMLLRRPSSPSSTPPSASALLGSSVGAIDPFGSCQTILYTHFLERTCVEEAGSAVEDTHASARPPSSPSEHRSPSFWRRKFKFGATPKPPAPMKKVHHRSHNMWVNK